MGITVTRPEQSVEFCTNIALKSAHERAVADVKAAQQAAQSDPRETGSAAVRAAAERVQALEAEMRADTIVFTVRGLRRKRWVEFVESNPPRDGNAIDKSYGINVPALDQVIPESIVAVTELDGSPVDFDAEAEWIPLADEMTNGQWSDFANAVIAVNHEVRSAPFSPLASAVIRRSVATSTEPPN
jgi:hypothetical protein